MYIDIAHAVEFYLKVGRPVINLLYYAAHKKKIVNITRQIMRYTAGIMNRTLKSLT